MKHAIRILSVLVIALFAFSTLASAGVLARPPPPPSQIPLTGNIYAKDQNGQWKEPLNGALVTLTQFSSKLPQNYFLLNSCTRTVNSYFQFYVPAGYPDGSKFYLRVWYDGYYTTQAGFTWACDADGTNQGLLMIVQDLVTLSSTRPIQRFYYPDVYEIQATAPVGAVNFVGAAKNYGLAEVGWYTSQSTSYSFRAGVTVGGSYKFADGSLGLTYNNVKQVGSGVGQTNTYIYGGWVGHMATTNVRVYSTWPEVRCVDMVKFRNPDSLDMNTYGYTSYYSPPAPTETFAKQQYLAGNNGPGSAWIPRSSWLGVPPSYWPFMLRQVDQSTLNSNSWTLDIKGGLVKNAVVNFKVQMQWSSSNSWTMHWKALLASDPGASYAGVLLWTPNKIVDQSSSVSWPACYNMMYVYLCTAPP